MGNSVLKKVEWLTWKNSHAHQSKLILVSLGQHLTRGGGLVGGRVSPPYTDDFEFLCFFVFCFLFFFFFGGGGAKNPVCGNDFRFFTGSLNCESRYFL